MIVMKKLMYIATLIMQNVATIRMLHDCTVENAMTPAQQNVYTNDDFQRARRKQNSNSGQVISQHL